MIPFRACVVAIVSDPHQATADKASLDQQEADCRQACESREWRIAETVIIPGHSRDYDWLHQIIADCPEYAHLVQMIEAEQINLVVVRDYDRLWRTDALRAQVMAVCRAHACQVYSLNQPIEPTDPDLLDDASDSAMIMEALSGVISQAENRSRTRRIKVGKMARIERGMHLFSNNIPYGYERAGDGTLAVVPEEAEVVRWMYRTRAEDRVGYSTIARELTQRRTPPPSASRGKLSTGSIASATGFWWANSVREMLRNPVYVGHLRWGDAYCTDAQHEPLITDALWSRVRAVDTAHAGYQTRGMVRGHRLLSGLARCGHCDHAMAYVPNGTRLGLRCSAYLSSHGQRCMSNWMRAEPVEAHVLEAVQQALADPHAHLEARREQFDTGALTDERAQIDKAVAAFDAGKQRWDHAYEIGSIPLDELLRHRREIAGETVRLDDRRKAIDAMLAGIDAAADSLDQVADLAPLLPTLDLPALRQVYHALIHHIALRSGEDPVIAWL